jgi:hypothetical protein
MLARLLTLLSCLLISACSTIPEAINTSADAQQKGRVLLDRAQQAHGAAAFRQLRDVSIAYGNGHWYTIVTKVQPELTDIGFRQTSQERMLFENGRTLMVAQEHTGPSGKKFVLRDTSSASPQTRVWANGQTGTRPNQREASALVVAAYQLFLYPAFAVDRAKHLEAVGAERVNGRDVDVLLAIVEPGFGDAPNADRVLLYIDRTDGLVRRIRLTLEAYAGTRGAIVDMDLDRFVEVGGVKWPTYFYEYLIKPFRGLPAHEFSLVGIDVNRGLTTADIGKESGSFSAAGAKPAAAISK